MTARQRHRGALVGGVPYTTAETVGPPLPPARAGLAIQAGRWIDRAVCRGMDPELFHPGRGESTAEAKAVCAACRVATECLEYALAKPEKEGVWGGRSERERKRIRRARRQAAREAAA